jgi:hypothetical protein
MGGRCLSVRVYFDIRNYSFGQECPLAQFLHVNVRNTPSVGKHSQQIFKVELIKNVIIWHCCIQETEKADGTAYVFHKGYHISNFLY